MLVRTGLLDPGFRSRPVAASDPYDPHYSYSIALATKNWSSDWRKPRPRGPLMLRALALLTGAGPEGDFLRPSLGPGGAGSVPGRGRSRSRFGGSPDRGSHSGRLP